jgi:hypothetical protein
MRSLLWAVALLCLVPVSGAWAGEAVDTVGRAVGGVQYPKTQTICMSFESKDQKRYLICDDVTSKDVIERLFEFGKKDAECRIQGTVANKTNEAIYLNITEPFRRPIERPLRRSRGCIAPGLCCGCLGQIQNAPYYFRVRGSQQGCPAVAADDVGLAESGEAVFGRIANVFRTSDSWLPTDDVALVRQ